MIDSGSMNHPAGTENRKVITRFPPSPTGLLQIGNARTALFNYLFAKHHGGQFFLRIEDTDHERSKKKYEENILEALDWMDLKSDNRALWRQSEREDIYRTHLKNLVADDKAYLSEETEGERDEVIRFRNPNKKIVFEDLLRGTIEFDTTELGDFVIAKSMEEPLYHLAVVVDDSEMGVTHVIRGEDHISNTPRQILLQETFGFDRPLYAHLPLILAADRSKLSKRHGAIAVTEYKERGFLPNALVNYIALLGWNPGTNQEIFSIEELIALFELSKVQRGGAVFNEEKLRWMNKEYLKRTKRPEDLRSYIPAILSDARSPTQLSALEGMLFERISVFGDVQAELNGGELSYLIREPTIDRSLLCWKGENMEEVRRHLRAVRELLAALPLADFNRTNIQDLLLPYAQREGKGNVLWPLRFSLSGEERSPDPFTLVAILGKDESMRRIQKAETL